MTDTLRSYTIIYSEPGDSGFTRAEGEPQKEFSNEGSQFVIRPFQDQSRLEIVKLTKVVADDLTSLDIELNSILDAEIGIAKHDYLLKVEEAVQACKEGLGKVVLSRQSVELNSNLNVSKSLWSLRKNFPNAFVYLIDSPFSGTWVGATPEVLIEREGKGYHTVALAGTKWGDELFGEKEFQEQMLVTKDIMSKLIDQTIEVSDVHEVPYGDIRHLKTDIRWEDERNTKEIAEELHPTPAVCGYPSLDAFHFIKDHEGYDRNLYTGYLGVLESPEKSRLFVNLRCFRLFRDAQVFFAGGGINSLSNAEVEWEETERKIQALKSNLVYD